MGKKFYIRRRVEKGAISVETGFRSGTDGPLFRLHLPNEKPVSLTYLAAESLADCLDEALDQQEREPLT